jgi:K+-transporting ATPase ATPase A chain
MEFLKIDSGNLLQLVLYFLVLLVLAKPLGIYIAKIFAGDIPRFAKPIKPLESFCYRILGVNVDSEMDWQAYSVAVVSFCLGGILLLFVLLKIQAFLPLNPQNFGNLSSDLAFNIAVSFVTNTNWQSYSGEETLSYFTQAFGLSVQNFLSAGVGMAVLAALMRSLTRKNTKALGNFWIDLVRTVLYVFLPLALIWSVLLGSQGVVQSFLPTLNIATLEKNSSAEKNTQAIAVGPVASQVAIKQLGTNGGGFFNANSAHPLENPTAFSNFLQLLAILLIPAALCFTMGKMVGDARQGRTLLFAMLIIFIPLLLTTIAFEQQGNPAFSELNIDQKQSSMQSGGNMEGKETRFGVVSSALWSIATTAASNGSVNSMHASYNPLSNAAMLLLMQCGEVIFGGVGSGLYGMLIFVLLSVFVAGLMVGRTPEYLGKKIQAFEMKMVSIAIILPSAFVLLGTALAVSTEAGRAGIFNPAADGFSEILYAFTSAANNNGSALAGINANTPFYNIVLAICMLAGRFGVLLPVLAIAGSLASKNNTPVSAGTLPTHTPLFVFLLAMLILLIGVLTFVPALALGPIASYLNLING